MDIVAGIDYAMTSPSITVKNDKGYQSFYLTNKRKYEGKQHTGIYGTFNRGDWESQEQRFNFVSSWAIEVLKGFNVNKVCLEGYAMGAKGQVFHIGENTGLLKHKLWDNDIKFVTPTPSQIKKFARELQPQDKWRDGDGKLIKMDKQQMIRRYFEETGTSLYDVFKSDETKKDLHPMEDIADSYFMCRWMELNH